MTHVIRAVYKGGSLHPLDPVDFTEGQEVQLTFLSVHRVIRNALAGLLISPHPITHDDEIDEAALLHEIEEAFRGQPSLSQTILEDRQMGP
jgi:predicted DNA-binding antitoxin AbrB/MazE fold protein